jgi:hypothetical protein
MADIIPTVPFNFDEIYSTFVNQLGNDAVYEGSNLAQLITSMSYMISMLNANTAANINESFLPIARKDENVLEGARLFGYEEQKQTSYRYTLELVLLADISALTPITIKKNMQIKNALNNYLLLDDYIISGAAGSKVYIEVIEGILKSYTEYDSLNFTIGSRKNTLTGAIEPNPEVNIPFVNVEEDGIEIFVSYVNKNGTQIIDEKWTKSDLFLLDKDYLMKKEFLRKDDINYKTAKIYFSYAGIGNVLPVSSVVKINAIVTQGINGAIDFTQKIEFKDSVYGNTVLLPSGVDLNKAFSITNNTISEPDLTKQYPKIIAQGSDSEPINKIQQTAPLFYNTGSRVITSLDYETFCNRQSNISVSEVWGGDEEYPLRPGEVWLSLFPSNRTRTFTDSTVLTAPVIWSRYLDNQTNSLNLFLEPAEISNIDLNFPGIFQILDYYKIPTLQLIHRNPVSLNCDFSIQILKYSNLKTKSDVHNDVFNIVDALFYTASGLYNVLDQNSNFLEQYNSEFYMSTLTQRIEAAINDSSGFTISMKNSVQVLDEHLSKESITAYKTYSKANASFFLNLEFPKEGILGTNGYLLTDRLPNIDYPTFSIGTSHIVSGALAVDWTGKTSTDYRYTDYIYADIKLGTAVVGKYELFNDYRRKIVITLFFIDDTLDANGELPTGQFATTTLTRTSLQESSVEIPVSFYTPNFKVQHGTIPRLRKVEFYA